jgi:hypothetical protein
LEKSPPQVERGETAENSKYLEEPQNHSNDNQGIQNRFNGSRHGNEAIDEPEKHTNHDQDHEHVK